MTTKTTKYVQCPECDCGFRGDTLPMHRFNGARCPGSPATTMTGAQKTARIAELNDLCRMALGITGRVVQTPGFNALDDQAKSALREKIETFSTFTFDNDPHGEHDFGCVEHDGTRVFWKIDYYDTALEGHSDDAADPAQTVRVLTIMLAEEY